MIEDFKINGNKYHLIEQSDKAMLWQGTTVGGHIFWETWLRRVSKTDKKLPDGSIFPAGSLLKPSAEQFGTLAWSHMTDDRARAKYSQINLEGMPNLN